MGTTYDGGDAETTDFDNINGGDAATIVKELATIDCGYAESNE